MSCSIRLMGIFLYLKLFSIPELEGQLAVRVDNHLMNSHHPELLVKHLYGVAKFADLKHEPADKIRLFFSLRFLFFQNFYFTRSLSSCIKMCVILPPDRFPCR